MTGAWHVAEGQRTLGTFSDEEMEAAISARQFPKDARVWRDGLAGWEPIGQHFSSAAAYGPSGRRRGGGLEAVALVVSTAVFAIALAAVVYLLYLNGLDLIPSDQVMAVWLISGVALAAGALSAPALWWRWAGRRAGLEVRGVVRILAALMFLSGGVVAAMELRQTLRVSEVAAAAEDLRDYGFSFDSDTRVLKVTGMIGPGFYRALEAELDLRPVDRLEITSSGGLIDEAMRAARMLEQRPGIEVAARRECLSACIIVLMGGERRLADYDMAIGFHAVASIMKNEGSWWKSMTRLEGRRSDRYMIRRGVPEQHLREAERLGPQSLYMVSSVDLVEDGMLTGLLNDTGRPVPVGTAKILLEGSRPSSVEAFAED